MQHQLVAVPTPETLAYLKSVFGDCPIEIDWEGLYVELNADAESDVEGRDLVAFPRSLEVVYTPDMGTNWVLFLISEDSALDEGHMVLRWGMPPLKRHRRGLRNSYADIMYASEQPLVFHDAHLVEVPDGL